MNGTCDRCAATARVLVELGSGGHLQFCGHHARQAEKAGLKDAALLWTDDDLQQLVKAETEAPVYVEAPVA